MACWIPSVTLLLVLLVALLQAHPSSGCQFPGEVQGVWATQAITDAEDPLASRRQGQVTYSMVTIENNRISGWGECADKRKHHYVLAERSRLGGAACHRCFHLLVVSPNVVVATSRRGGGCHPTVEDALRSCPEVLNHHLHDFERGESGRGSDHRWERDNQAETKEHLEEIRRETQQIMLYKVKSSWGDESVAEVECPISGVFTFTYERGREGALGFRDEGASHSEGLEKETLCPHPTSEMSNCPYGFGLNILYRDCSYGQPEPVALQCLGGWRGAGGVRHLAVLDTSVRGADTRPKYRCGMYHEESNTGRIHLSFSRDSTCETQLHSPTDGFERYLLTSVPAPPLPQAVQTHSSCRFPRSLEGHWTSVLLDHNTLVFKDQRNLKRYTAVCVDDVGDGEHFIVFTRTHCGDSNYNCLWLKRRSANILEFMLGLYPNETLDSSLCDAGKFGDETSWNTVAKSELESPTRCPLQGSFVGELPDAPGYCARLRSHCSRPHAMTYVVTDCRNATSAYEHSSRDTQKSPPNLSPPPQLPPEIQVSVLPIDRSSPGSSGSSRRTPTEIVVSAGGPNGQIVRLPPPVITSNSQQHHSMTDDGNINNHFQHQSSVISSGNFWVPPEITVSSQGSHLDTRSDKSYSAFLPAEISISTNSASAGGLGSIDRSSFIVSPELIQIREDLQKTYSINPLAAQLTISDPSSPRNRSKRSSVTVAPRVSRAKTTALNFHWGAGHTTTPSPPPNFDRTTFATSPSTPATPLPRKFDSVSPNWGSSWVRPPSESNPERERVPSVASTPYDPRRPYNPLKFWPSGDRRIQSEISTRKPESFQPITSDHDRTRQYEGSKLPGRAAWITEINQDKIATDANVREPSHPRGSSSLNQPPISISQEPNRSSGSSSLNQPLNPYPTGRLPPLNQGRDKDRTHHHRVLPPSTTRHHAHTANFQTAYIPLTTHSIQTEHRSPSDSNARDHYNSRSPASHVAVDLLRPVDLPFGAPNRPSPTDNSNRLGATRWSSSERRRLPPSNANGERIPHAIDKSTASWNPGVHTFRKPSNPRINDHQFNTQHGLHVPPNTGMLNNSTLRSDLSQDSTRGNGSGRQSRIDYHSVIDGIERGDIGHSSPDLHDYFHLTSSGNRQDHDRILLVESLSNDSMRYLTPSEYGWKFPDSNVRRPPNLTIIDLPHDHSMSLPSLYSTTETFPHSRHIYLSDGDGYWDEKGFWVQRSKQSAQTTTTQGEITPRSSHGSDSWSTQPSRVIVIPSIRPHFDDDYDLRIDDEKTTSGAVITIGDSETNRYSNGDNGGIKISSVTVTKFGNPMARMNLTGESTLHRDSIGRRITELERGDLSGFARAEDDFAEPSSVSDGLQSISTFYKEIQLSSMKPHEDIPSPRPVVMEFREREYQCIGEWTEGDRIYALTYRPDTHSHECFVGMKTPDGKMFIKEAGSVSGICGRGVKPEIMGMELVQKADCSSESVAAALPVPAEPGLASPRSSATPPRPPQPPARPPWQRPQKQETSTKPWKPITAPPRWLASSSLNTSSPGRYWLLACWSCLVTLVTTLICDALVT